MRVIPIAIVSSLGLVGVIVGAWVHELTHYTLSRIFGGDSEIFYSYGLPSAVSLDEPSLSDNGLRVAGGATIVYPAFLFFVYLPLFGFPPLDIDNFQSGVYLHLLTFFVLVASSGFSPSDCLALISPSEFRVYARKEQVTHSQALHHLLHVARDITLGKTH